MAACKTTSTSSLHTTAADYARFLQASYPVPSAIIGTAKRWLDPQVRLDNTASNASGKNVKSQIRVAWGHGKRVLNLMRAFYIQWGNNDG